MFHYSARPDLLKDRVILVTGAGRGIGRAASLDLRRPRRHRAAAGQDRGLPQRGLRPHRGRRPPGAGGHPVQPGDRPAAPVRGTGGHDRERVRPHRRPAAQRLDPRPALADGADFRGELHARDAGERQCHVHADPRPAAAAEALQRRLDDLHLQQRGPQGPRLLGRLFGIEVRHRGPDADPGRRMRGHHPRSAPTASTRAPPAPGCALLPTRGRTR